MQKGNPILGLLFFYSSNNFWDLDSNKGDFL
jgi:hypothetical protein